MPKTIITAIAITNILTASDFFISIIPNKKLLKPPETERPIQAAMLLF
jgi:hypothetical protein